MRKRKWSKNLGRDFLLGMSFSTVLMTALFVWIAIQFFRTEFPDPSVLKTSFPIVHYRGLKDPVEISVVSGRPANWVAIGDVSKAATGAIIVSEDWAFYTHKGYDANQIKEAIQEDWEQRRFARGASTITQQVVRNIFLSKDKNLWRKLKEFYLAIQVEKSLSKRRILEIYLNIAEWGEGIYGIGPASRHYFGKAPSQLTAKEGAFLAMLLPSPKRYSQSFRARRLTDYARETIDSILSKMTQAHYLTEEERQVERVHPLAFEQSPAGAL